MPPNGIRYSKEVADRICKRMVEGQSLVSICKEAGMPVVSTVYVWLAAHRDFEENYARARSEQADVHAEEMLDVARRRGATSEDCQSNRLLVDTLKWRAGKLKPRVYGDKLLLDAEINVRHMTDAELQARATALAASLGYQPPAVPVIEHED